MSLMVHETSSPGRSGQGEKKPAFQFICADPRADERQRAVSVECGRVLISRQLQGMAMRIGVPTRAYRGVALSLCGEGTGLWRIALVHRDRDLDVCLAESVQDDDIVADWRSWAEFFRLPALVESQPGTFALACPGAAAALPASPKPRRRGALLRGRRARFLLRRKTGDIDRLATRFAGEAEIIARN